MSHDKEISIIIPVYNEEKRITKCLDRVLDFCRQKQYNFEIIVVDDGSEDNTSSLLSNCQFEINLISKKQLNFA